MIGKLRSVVLDCPEPQRVAEFYAGVSRPARLQQFHRDIEVDGCRSAQLG